MQSFTKLIILGKSAGVITMVCDNLTSLTYFTRIQIINNLNIQDGREYKDSHFDISETVETKVDYSSKEKVFIIGGYNPEVKEKIFELFNVPTEYFYNVIHKSIEISGTSKLGNGIIVNSLVSIAAHTTIGNFVTINRHASIGHHSVLEDFVTISPSATICGNVKIGRGTYIGAGVVVRDGITIGKGCTIGAGSVVVKDIQDGCKGYGNPYKTTRWGIAPEAKSETKSNL